MTTDQDFSARVARLQATAGVDGVFALSGPDTAGIIVKQIRETGLAVVEIMTAGVVDALGARSRDRIATLESLRKPFNLGS